MSNELKPCPHCGSERIWIEDIDIRGMDRYYAICVQCGAKSGNEETPEKAASNWNMRAERTCHNVSETSDVRDEVHISALSNGFQCDGSVWRCCKCGAFFTNMYIKCDHCGAEVRGYAEEAIQCWNALNEPRAHETCHPKTITYEDYMESDVCSECGRPLDGNGFQARFCSWCGRKVVRP